MAITATASAQLTKPSPWIACHKISIGGNAWAGALVVAMASGRGAPPHPVSSDEARIAANSNVTTVCIWDVDTGERLLALHGHEQFMMAIAWSPDD